MLFIGLVFFRGLYKFYNREYLNIIYCIDLEVLRKIVLELFELVGLYVKFEMMVMFDIMGLGLYIECG